MGLIEKTTIQQVFGSLMQKPLLVNEVSNQLNKKDFPSRFYSSIYMAIYNLVQNGAETISSVDVYNYLKAHEVLYEEFSKRDGVRFLQDCEEVAQLENFKYYCERLRKFTILRELKRKGYDITSVYFEDDNNVQKELEIKEKFDKMSSADIFNTVTKDLIELEQELIGTAGSCHRAYDGLLELTEQLKIEPEIGLPLQGELYNTIVRGARLGKFYLKSSVSGGGKSRSMFGEACALAYPFRYNVRTQNWETTGNSQKVLIITTELDTEEVQTILLAYLTGINEEKILFGNYTTEEDSRRLTAIRMMEKYSDNLIIENLPDPTIGHLKSLVKKHAKINEVRYVFYDYIASSPGLLNEFRDVKVREDVALMMFSTALKELAKDLHIFIMSATQINGDITNHKGIRNQNLIRGAKAIADKVDMGCITMPVSEDEMNMLSELVTKLKMPMPTQVTDIYKLRRGRFKNVRIWSILDLGTARVTDLFVTDSFFNPIDITRLEVSVEDTMDLAIKQEKEEKKKVTRREEIDLSENLI